MFQVFDVEQKYIKKYRNYKENRVYMASTAVRRERPYPTISFYLLFTTILVLFVRLLSFFLLLQEKGKERLAPNNLRKKKYIIFFKLCEPENFNLKIVVIIKKKRKW